MDELTQLKMALYHALLVMPTDQLTDNEIEIGYRLCLDKAVQREIGTRLAAMNCARLGKTPPAVPDYPH